MVWYRSISNYQKNLEKIELKEDNWTYTETIAHSEIIPKVVISIPAYNEEKTIGDIVRNIIKIMKNTKYKNNFLVLVANDGSEDKTIEKASEAGAYVYSNKKNLGLAETFRTEMSLCLNLNADIIVHTDADGQYAANDIPKLISEVEKGYDLVLGNRFMGGIQSMPAIKKFGNRAFSLVLSLLTRRKISDWQTGFRAFSKVVMKDIPIISDHTYTQEQIIRATKQNFKIKEVPTYFSKRKDGQSRLMKNPINYAIRAWKNIFRIYMN